MKVEKGTVRRWGWGVSILAFIIALSPLFGWTILSGLVLGSVLIALGITILSEARRMKKEMRNIFYLFGGALAVAGFATVGLVQIPPLLVSFVSGLQVLGGLATVYVIHT